MISNSNKKALKTEAKYWLGLAAFLGLALLIAAFNFTTKDGFDLSRQELLFRNIGHEVLLQSKDSLSRVLPIKKLSATEFEIRFENEFTFQPDSLEKIISRSLAKDKLAHNYIVNVLKCGEKKLFLDTEFLKMKSITLCLVRGEYSPKAVI